MERSYAMLKLLYKKGLPFGKKKEGELLKKQVNGKYLKAYKPYAWDFIQDRDFEGFTKR